MTELENKRPMWRVVSVYAAISRVCLQFILETSIKPFFKYPGTPDADKNLMVTGSNQFVLAYSAANRAIRESLDWMDRYLGPVK